MLWNYKSVIDHQVSQLIEMLNLKKLINLNRKHEDGFNLQGLLWASKKQQLLVANDQFLIEHLTIALTLKRTFSEASKEGHDDKIA